MRIVIEKDNDINESFLHWIIRFIKVEILKELNNNNLDRLNAYINEFDFFKSGQSINLKKIIFQALNTLNFKYSGNYYIISFNEIIPLYDTEYKIIDVLNFITYGNFEVRGCTIISDIFDSIHYNLKLYKKLYHNGYII